VIDLIYQLALSFTARCSPGAQDNGDDKMDRSNDLILNSEHRVMLLAPPPSSALALRITTISRPRYEDEPSYGLFGFTDGIRL